MLVCYFGFLEISTDEPGKQVSSAIKIKNVSRSHVAFKVSRSFLTLHFSLPRWIRRGLSSCTAVSEWLFILTPEFTDRDSVVIVLSDPIELIILPNSP